MVPDHALNAMNRFSMAVLPPWQPAQPREPMSGEASPGCVPCGVKSVAPLPERTVAPPRQNATSAQQTVHAATATGRPAPLKRGRDGCLRSQFRAGLSLRAIIALTKVDGAPGEGGGPGRSARRALNAVAKRKLDRPALTRSSVDDSSRTTDRKLRQINPARRSPTDEYGASRQCPPWTESYSAKWR